MCCGLVARLVPASFITVKSGTTSLTKGSCGVVQAIGLNSMMRREVRLLQLIKRLGKFLILSYLLGFKVHSFVFDKWFTTTQMLGIPKHFSFGFTTEKQLLLVVAKK